MNITTQLYPYWHKHPTLIEFALRIGAIDTPFAISLLSPKAWNDHPEWATEPAFVVALLQLNKPKIDQMLATNALSTAHWVDYPNFILALLDRDHHDTIDAVIRFTLKQDFWTKHPQLVMYVIERFSDRQDLMNTLIREVLSKPFLATHLEPVMKLLSLGRVSIDQGIAEHLLSQETWKDRTDIVQLLQERHSADKELTAYVLKKSKIRNHPECNAELLAESIK